MSTTDSEGTNRGTDRVVGAVMVMAGRHSAAEALGSLRSIETADAGLHPVALVTEPVADLFNGYDTLLLTDVLPGDCVVTELLADEDQLAYVEPFALRHLVDRYGTVAVLDAGAFLLGGLTSLSRALTRYPLVLTAPAVVPPGDSTVPHLTQRDPEDVTSGVVVGVTTGSGALLDRWEQTMTESLFDPNLRAPSALRSGVPASLCGLPGVGVDGAGTVIRWSDWATAHAASPPPDLPPVVDAAGLWELTRGASGTTRSAGDEAAAPLIDLRIHDSSPLGPFISAMDRAVTDSSRVPEPTPYEQFAKAVRRATDPTGARWPAGDSRLYQTWLYEVNDRGLTRIADLYWYSDPDVAERFPRARVDPGEYLQWCRSRSRPLLGFDLLDPHSTPVIPSEENRAGESGGWKNALSWRWNIAKGFFPGVNAAGERRARGLDAASGPGSGRGSAAPREISVPREPSLWGSTPRSLTIIGGLRAESGLGQAARASVRAIRTLEIPFSYVDASELFPSRSMADPQLGDALFGALGDVNLLHMNASELINMNNTVLRHRLGGRFNAAMWFWEAGQLPRWQLPALDRIDELWVASGYVADVLGQYGRVPVHNIGLATPLPAARVADRAALGIAPEDFVFTFVYDALSSHGRKNPELALEAFIEAFGPDFAGVRFIVKAASLNKLPEDRERLMRLADATDAITVIDRYLDHERVYDLMAAADVYVSLHTAEGYGLTILEAMSLGTPAICTGYSGNMDFTTEENSWLVDYDLVRVEASSGPYPQRSVWARPNLESAVEAMRRAVAHPDEVEAKARAAQRDAREAASLERYAANLGAQLRRIL